ncbi:MAG TPA: hypothetical protein VIZ18_17690, partial [Ktedonobacteraceae bacterium]
MGTKANTSGSAGVTLANAWQNYGLSLLMLLVLPLLPAMIEWGFKGSLDEASLLITLSIFAASIAIASNNRLIFGVGLIIAIGVAACYGIVYGIATVVNAGSGTVVQTNVWGLLITSENPSLSKFAYVALVLFGVLVLLTV